MDSTNIPLAGDFVGPEALSDRRAEARLPNTPSPAEGSPPNRPSAPPLVTGHRGATVPVPEDPLPARSHVHLWLEALLLEVPGQPVVPIQCQETSRSGMGLVSGRTLGVQERLAVRFCFADRPDRLVLCEVRHCTALSAQAHRAEVAFIDSVGIEKGRPAMIPSHWPHPLERPSQATA